MAKLLGAVTALVFLAAIGAAGVEAQQRQQDEAGRSGQATITRGQRGEACPPSQACPPGRAAADRAGQSWLTQGSAATIHGVETGGGAPVSIPAAQARGVTGGASEE